MTTTKLDPELHEKMRHVLAQEFRMASGHESGVHPTKRGHKRPEALVFVADNTIFFGHTTRDHSAAAEALTFYDMNLRLKGIKAEDAQITFAMVAVGFTPDNSEILSPSRELLKDIKGHASALTLRELEVYPGNRGVLSEDDSYVHRFRNRGSTSGPSAEP